MHERFELVGRSVVLSNCVATSSIIIHRKTGPSLDTIESEGDDPVGNYLGMEGPQRSAYSMWNELHTSWEINTADLHTTKASVYQYAAHYIWSSRLYIYTLAYLRYLNGLKISHLRDVPKGITSRRVKIGMRCNRHAADRMSTTARI